MKRVDGNSGMNLDTTSLNSRTDKSSVVKKTWHAPCLINLNLAETSVGKGTSPSEGCHPNNGQCKPQWVDSFGPS